MSQPADDLFDLLVCPESRASLIHFPAGADGEAGEFLLCPTSRLRYRVEDGLPIMLVEEAERLPAPEISRLIVLAKSQGLRLPDLAPAADA